MNGWIFIQKLTNSEIPSDAWQLQDKVDCENFFAGREVLNKFEKDRLFVHCNHYFVIVDGVIFNKLQLIQKYGQNSWQDTVLKMLEKGGETFFNEFRGTFNGIVYDDVKNTLFAFTDHVSSKNLFYYKNDNVFVVSSNFNCIYDVIKKNGYAYSLSQTAVDYMLTYAYMLDDTTFFNEVKRINPGNYIKFDGSNIKSTPFYIVDNTKTETRTDDEWIELLDDCFRKAVKLEFDKDKEYGYSPVADMSGGLDSRMISWVAKDMGYNNIINISYSQSGSLDDKVAAQVSNALDTQYIFKHLDDASFLYDVDEMVTKNFGSVYYASITGGNQLLKSLSLQNCGLEHTGLLGDMGEGTFSLFPYHLPSGEIKRYRFTQLLDIPLDPKIFAPFPNQELCWFYIRGLIAGLSTNLIRQNYTETCSPFADPDFLKLSFSIPLERRTIGTIFEKWMIKKYPESTKFVYAKNGCRITTPLFIIAAKKHLLSIWNSRIKGTLKRVGILENKASPIGMNPFQYWYENKKELRDFMASYYSENIGRLDDQPKRQEQITRLMQEGTTLDKLAGITVLSILKNYF